jgi:CheY-like chemotaxis protein
VALVPGAVQAVAVVLHELATNAVKHGALSAPEGHVTLSWKREAGGGLRIDWVERDGPSPAPPGRQGFGWKLIEATVRGQLGGSVLRQWEPEGLRCEVTIAANRLLWREGPAALDAVEAGAKPDAADVGARPAPPPPLAGRRILVAEDEPLVALELEAQLRALHCEVIGPAAMLEDALRLAASAPLDAAVLDINLAGRASFPVAELLTGREVPVIFATGYGELPAGGAGRRHLLLRKPLASGELEAALRQVLAKDGAQGRTHAPSGSLPAAEGEGTVSPRLRRGGGHALD